MSERRPSWAVLWGLVWTISACTTVHRSVTLESDPPGATVYVNGEEVGQTPVTTELVFKGKKDQVEIALEKELYQRTERTLDPEVSDVLRVELEPAERRVEDD